MKLSQIILEGPLEYDPDFNREVDKIQDQGGKYLGSGDYGSVYLLKGKAVKKGTRLARFVYLEKGKIRNNLHAHFYFKGSTQAQTLSTILYATELWHKVNNAETIDIRKQIDKRLNAYCTKEIDDLDNDVMLLDCTHKAQN